MKRKQPASFYAPDYTDERSFPLAFRRAMYDVHVRIGQTPQYLVVRHKHLPVNPDRIRAQMPGPIQIGMVQMDYTLAPVPDLPWEHYLMLVVSTMMTGEHATADNGHQTAPAGCRESQAQPEGERSED